MLGIIDILCRGGSYFQILGFRLCSVWDLPIFLRLRLFWLRKVHDVMLRIIAIFCRVALYFLFLGCGLYSVWAFPIFLRLRLFLFPKQCLHYGVLTLGVKELVAGRNGAHGGGARPSFRRSRCGFARIAFRRSRCGFARIPLRFDAPAVVSRAFRPLLACSGLFWPRLRAATAHAVGRDLRFDSREFSTLPPGCQSKKNFFQSKKTFFQ